jgi:hypothetical protein
MPAFRSAGLHQLSPRSTPVPRRLYTVGYSPTPSPWCLLTGRKQGRVYAPGRAAGVFLVRVAVHGLSRMLTLSLERCCHRQLLLSFLQRAG